jgi:hypothetical protein
MLIRSLVRILLTPAMLHDRVALVAQRVYKTAFCGRPCIVKERFSKKYRHEQLDAMLTKRRLYQVCTSLASYSTSPVCLVSGGTSHCDSIPAARSRFRRCVPLLPRSSALSWLPPQPQEARGIVKCSRSGVLAPALYYVDEAKAHLYLEYIDAPTVRAVLASKPGQGMLLHTQQHMRHRFCF